MNTICKVAAAFLLTSLLIGLTGCEPTERSKAAGEKLQGAAQETAGEVTNDTELKNKGKWNRTKGDLRDTKEDVKDIITDQ